MLGVTFLVVFSVATLAGEAASLTDKGTNPPNVIAERSEAPDLQLTDAPKGVNEKTEAAGVPS